MTIGTYSVGVFTDPQPDDETFADITEARSAAKTKSRMDILVPIAVWYRDELDRVFLRGYELEPVPL